MKKIVLRIVLGSLVMVAGLSSCKKVLDQDPSNAIRTENAFNSMGDFEQAARGMYYLMTHAENYLGGSDDGISWVSSMDLMADNLITQQTGRGSQRSYSRWNYLPSNAGPTYAQGYSIIRAANALIENKDKIAGTEAIYGEALAVRGMVHFDMLRLYSKPLAGSQAAPQSLGVPYVTTTSLAEQASRPTAAETYAKVVDDLKLALDFISDDSGDGRLNKAAVYGLLSRVYLYGGEWTKSVDAATECLAIKSDPGSLEKFPQIWTDATDDGVLFKLKFTQQDIGADGILRIGVAYNQISGTGYRSEWVITKSFYDLYQDSDVRKASYIETAPYRGVDYNAVIKYLRKADGTPPQIVDLKYLRVAEVLLNRSEAYAMLGDDVNALADINALRENRYHDFSPGTETGTVLKEAINLERRLELAFEGDRWFTLKRQGLPVVRDTFGDLADGSGTPTPAPSLDPGDHRWLLPIPMFDIQANPNLQQNPNY